MTNDFMKWFRGYGSSNEDAALIDRLKRENADLSNKVKSLQIFYDDQSDQMTELKKEVVNYKVALNDSLKTADGYKVANENMCKGTYDEYMQRLNDHKEQCTKEYSNLLMKEKGLLERISALEEENKALRSCVEQEIEEPKKKSRKNKEQ